MKCLGRGRPTVEALAYHRDWQGAVAQTVSHISLPTPMDFHLFFYHQQESQFFPPKYFRNFLSSLCLQLTLHIVFGAEFRFQQDPPTSGTHIQCYLLRHSLNEPQHSLVGSFIMKPMTLMTAMTLASLYLSHQMASQPLVFSVAVMMSTSQFPFPSVLFV